MIVRLISLGEKLVYFELYQRCKMISGFTNDKAVNPTYATFMYDP